MSIPVSAVEATKVHPLSAPGLWLLAVACGMLIANIYFGQPLTGLISGSLGMPKESVGLIVTLPLIGYGVGLLLIVPLGDLIENRQLILGLVSTEAFFLFLISELSNPVAFLTAAFFVGMSASAVQVILPLVSHVVPEAARGSALGRLVSGVMLGIMLARPISSFVSDLESWRTIYQLSALAMIFLVIAIRLYVPVRQPVGGPRYLALMLSMGKLFLETEVLRRRAFYQAAMFGSFSVFWTAVPLWLSSAPFNLSQKGIAWVALAGVAGAIAPVFAGRLADKGLSMAGTAGAMVLAALAFALSGAGFFGGVCGLGAVVVTAILLDFAVSANLVFSQRAIYSLGAEKRSRLNGLFMATFFGGGAIASALAGLLFARYGWVGVLAFGTALPILALGYWMSETRLR